MKRTSAFSLWKAEGDSSQQAGLTVRDWAVWQETSRVGQSSSAESCPPLLHSQLWLSTVAAAITLTQFLIGILTSACLLVLWQINPLCANCLDSCQGLSAHEPS